MTDFLNSVKADLLDRRLLPILGLLALALAAAVAYAALGGGGSTATTPAPVSTSAPGGASGIVARPSAASADQAVAETTSGASQQRAGASRNPFTPLPGSKSTTAAATTAAASSTTASSSTTATSGSSSPSTQSTSGSASQGSAGTSPSGAGKSTAPVEPKSTAPAKPETVYEVAVLFSGSPPQSAPLALFRNLSRQEVLPSSKQAVVAFRGVTAQGKSAMFTLVGNATLRGPGVCVPSDSRCVAITLKQGQTEELEYLQPSGSAVIYQLQILTISSRKASTATAQRLFESESKPGAEVLRRSGLAALPAGVHYSRLHGVLVFSAGPARAARSHRLAPSSPHKR